jgi:hypothetical protein
MLLPERGSTGIAAGCSLEDAVLQGLLEAVEHDAWFSAWRSGAHCPRLDLDDVRDPVAARLIDLFRSAGLDVLARDLTNDLRIPTFEVTLRSRLTLAHHQVPGFGAHLDPSIALGRALTEAGQLLCAHTQNEPVDALFQGDLSVCSPTVYFEARATSRVRGTRKMSDIPSMLPADGNLGDCLQRTVSLIAAAVPRADICLYDLSHPEAPGVSVVSAFVSCLNDEYPHISRVRARLLGYRRLMEGQDAPTLSVEDLFLGPIRH